jgi:hypothetical protein
LKKDKRLEVKDKVLMGLLSGIVRIDSRRCCKVSGRKTEILKYFGIKVGI